MENLNEKILELKKAIKTSKRELSQIYKSKMKQDTSKNRPFPPDLYFVRIEDYEKWGRTFKFVKIDTIEAYPFENALITGKEVRFNLITGFEIMPFVQRVHRSYVLQLTQDDFIVSLLEKANQAHSIIESTYKDTLNNLNLKWIL